VDEADIRTVLRDAAKQVRPAQDAPPPQLPQPRRGLAAKLGVVVTSLLIATAGVAIVVVAFLPGPQDQSAEMAESPQPKGTWHADNLLYWTKGDGKWELVRARDGMIEASISGGIVSSAISPDGSWLATVEAVSEGQGSVRLVLVASGDVQVVGNLPPINSLNWAGEGEIWLCDGDGSIRAVTFPERRVRLVAESVGCVEIALSPDGKRVAFSSFNGDILIAPRSDPSSGTVVIEQGNNGSPSWSPDGTQLVFHQFSGSDASIKVLDFVTGDLTTAVSGPGEHDLTPAWSPDGRTIAFVRDLRDGPTQVFLLDVATGTVQAVNPSAEAQDLPLWTGSPQPSPVNGVDTERAGLEVGVPYRIQLYTHCGIDFWTRFDGSYWDAVGYDNSSGIPPEGLGNPYDHGSMTLLSHNEARYVSQSGTVIRFTRAAERPKGMACF
jgi:hypothetical protein